MLLIYPNVCSSLPDWSDPEDPVAPITCYDHWSCIPAVEEGGDPTRLHGFELSYFGDGYFYQVKDKETYREVLKVRTTLSVHNSG